MSPKAILPESGFFSSLKILGISNRNIRIVTGCAIVAAHFLIFVQFFPNSHGKLGDDYSLFLPQLLDGVFWYNKNGLSEVPWFTPSFGGGLPNFPNPQSMYYSVPQFLCFLFDPITSIKLTILLFAIAGYFGFYLLVRRIFLVSPITALLGATLFLFNGFYAHRMIVGHLTFHSYMLLPFISFFALRGVITEKKVQLKRLVIDICAGSILIAYMFYTGAWHIVPALALTVLIISVIHKIVNNSFRYRHFLFKAFFILTLGSAIAASKLSASLSFLELFPRDLYPLPGVPGFSDLLGLCFASLFETPNIVIANKITVNKLFDLQLHEYEFGVGFIPFVVMTTGTFFFFKKALATKYFRQITIRQITRYILLFLLLLLPLLLNYYTPSWNQFLKSVPFVKNSATNIRWFSAYIPVLILLTCIIIEKTEILFRYKYPIVISGICIIILSNISRDRRFYDDQPYNPDVITSAYHELKSGKLKPEITSIETEVIMENGQVIIENNLLVFGFSQLYPYEPIFGYHLENYPIGSLVPGPAMQQNSSGILNIKNPSCYVFPKENNCAPGNHFTIDQRKNAEYFRNYLPFPFNISPRQRIANYITIISLCSVVCCLLVFVPMELYNRKKRHCFDGFNA